MQEAEVNKMKVDVARNFKQPQDILNDEDLATEQKIKLLKEWEIDLRQLMIASEENMPSGSKSGSTGEMLMKVSKALSTLGSESEATKEHPPTKLGG